MTRADELAGQGGEVTKVGGGQGTSHLGEAKSQRPVGFGLSSNLEMSSHPRLHFYVRYQGNGKSRNQQSDADQDRTERGATSAGFLRLLKRLFIFISLETPGVQADALRTI